MKTIAPDAGEWISGALAARLLGLRSAKALRKLADDGLVSVRRVPRTHPMYRRGDVEKLAQQSVQPARRAR